MKILFLLPDFPFPPSTGGRSKVFNELLYLSSNHQCDLLCLGKASDEQRCGLKAALPNVRVQNVIPRPSGPLVVLGAIWNLLRLLPVSLATFSDSKFAQEVTSCIAEEKYDVIHYDIINMAQYVSLGNGIPSVHSPNDATSMAYSRLAKQTAWSLSKLRLMLSAVLLRRYERKTYPGFTKVHVVSEVDAEYLRGIHPGINVSVIPIALGIEDSTVSRKAASVASAIHHNPMIICSGNFENSAISAGTEDFIDEAFPEIQANVPGTRLIILGRNAGNKLLEKIHQSDSIEYVEWVDDYNEFLSRADIVLAPDYAAAPGAKTRVLQSMGLALPVVGTRAAFEGIPVINGEHGFVYESMQECSMVMMDVLHDVEKKTAIGKAGFNLVKKIFSMEVIGPKYEKLYRDAIDSYS